MTTTAAELEELEELEELTYRVELTCLRCGAPLRHLADGRILAGSVGRATAQCAASKCSRTHLLTVRLELISTGAAADRQAQRDAANARALAERLETEGSPA